MITIASPQDLLALVPYLLGYRPDDGMVLVVCSPTGLHAAMRVEPQLASQSERVAADIVADVCRMPRIAAVTIVGYGTTDEMEPLMRSLRTSLARAGVPVLDALRVSGGRYVDLLCACHDPCRCPAEGIPIDASLTSVPAQAELAGLRAYGSREELASLLVRVDDAAALPVTRGTVNAQRHYQRLYSEATRPGATSPHTAWAKRTVRRVVHRFVTRPSIAPYDVAAMSVALQDQAAQDFAVVRTARQRYAVALWEEITRRCEPSLVPVPASLLAFCAWRQGVGGALVEAAIERALAIDPDFEPALVLRKALRQRIPSDLAFPFRGDSR